MSLCERMSERESGREGERERRRERRERRMNEICVCLRRVCSKMVGDVAKTGDRMKASSLKSKA